jgi:hypothetical protein
MALFSSVDCVTHPPLWEAVFRLFFWRGVLFLLNRGLFFVGLSVFSYFFGAFGWNRIWLEA